MFVAETENRHQGRSGEGMNNIRQAKPKDASRIAEILVFTKRMNYRRIFQNDKVSFGEIQVYPLAKEYIENPEKLQKISVYEDEFVKGMIHIEDGQIVELYVDPFFQGQGIGGRLIEYAVKERNCRYLWVLEKNDRAIRFYQRHGFQFTKERKQEVGTTEFLVKMERL